MLIVKYYLQMMTSVGDQRFFTLSANIQQFVDGVCRTVGVEAQ